MTSVILSILTPIIGRINADLQRRYVMATLADLNSKLDTLGPLVRDLKSNQLPAGTQQAIDAAAAKLDDLIAVATPPAPAAPAAAPTT